MKLRTELFMYGGRCSIGYMDKDDAEHDALSAHAYQIELSRMRKAAKMTAHAHNRELVLKLLDVLDRRADELMQQWLGETK